MSGRRKKAEGPPVVWRAAEGGPAVCEPAALAALAWPLLEGEWGEVMLMVCMDSQTRPKVAIEVARGCMDQCVIDPRLVFRAALVHGAHRIALVHNHPSGCPDLSEADRKVHFRMTMAGELLGMPVEDTMAMGSATRWSSMAMEGRA